MLPLTQKGLPDILIEAARHRHGMGSWYLRLIVVMPDHVHAMVRVPVEGSLRRVVSDWKRWTATKGEFIWQRDFFDHRLRTERAEREKAEYILHNPVRAGLVLRFEDWPHYWIPPE